MPNTDYGGHGGNLEAAARIFGRRPGFQASALYQYLGRQGILICVAENFAGLDQRYFRVAVRLRWENRLLLGALNIYFITEKKEKPI